MPICRLLLRMAPSHMRAVVRGASPCNTKKTPIICSQCFLETATAVPPAVVLSTHSRRHAALIQTRGDAAGNQSKKIPLLLGLPSACGASVRVVMGRGRRRRVAVRANALVGSLVSFQPTARLPRSCLARLFQTVQVAFQVQDDDTTTPTRAASNRRSNSGPCTERIFPALLGLARKIIRATPKNTHTHKIALTREKQKTPPKSTKNTPPKAQKHQQIRKNTNFFFSSRSRAKKQSFAWLSADKQAT